MLKNVSLAAAVAVLLAAAPVRALPLVTIEPTEQTVAVGDTVSVDIMISHLDPSEAIGGFSLVVSFNDAVLQGASYAAGSALGAVIDLGPGFGTGGSAPLELFFSSLEDPSDLADLQGESFSLATVSFTAVATGGSALRLLDVVLANADGTSDIFPDVSPGRVCVGEPCDAVPEPTSLLLFGVAVVGLATRRRQVR